VVTYALNIGSVTSVVISLSRQGSSPLDQADDNRHNRQNEKNVDEASHCVGGGKSKCPKNEQNHSNCPKHAHAFLECWSAPRRSEVSPEILHFIFLDVAGIFDSPSAPISVRPPAGALSPIHLKEKPI